MNSSRFANGSVIYTESGHFAREFARRTDGGMVGVNVGIPVPLGIFGFTGHKQSFFGDLHCMGRDGFIFYTESKNVTTTWFTGKSARQGEHLGRNHDALRRGASGECPAPEFSGREFSASSSPGYRRLADFAERSGDAKRRHKQQFCRNLLWRATIE